MPSFGNVVRGSLRFAAFLFGGFMLYIALTVGIPAFRVDAWFWGLEPAQQNAVAAAVTAFVSVKIATWLGRRGRAVSVGHVGPATLGAAAAMVSAAPAEGAARRADQFEKEPIETPEARQERVIYHEAGHAAVALHLGFSLRQVSVVADASTGGRVTLAGHAAGDGSNIAFWNKAIMAASGLAAEGRFLNHSQASGGLQDLGEVQVLCAALAAANFRLDGEKKTASEFVDEAHRRANAAVDEVAEHIEALASELRGKPVLSGKSAADVFSRVDGVAEAA